MRAWSLAVFAPLVIASACDNSAVAGDARAAVRDSAGVTIVENPHVSGDGGAHWVVDTVPTMSIGDESGDPAYQLTLIGGVQRLPNGMILVLNGAGESAFEFRFYDSAGKHVATHGRRGNGPGDYRWVSSVQPIGGDTVLAVDFPSRRLNWVSASEGYLRSIPIDEQLIGQIVGGSGRSISEGMTPFSDSLYASKSWHGGFRDPSSYISYQIVDLAARTSLPLGRIPNYPSAVALQTMHIVDRDRRRMCIARGSAAEISCIDASGARRIIRWASDVIPFTADDRAKSEAAMRARVNRSEPRAAAEMEKMIAERTWPESYPRIHGLQVDALGNFWIREMQRSGTGPITMRMRVLDPEGEHLAFATDIPLRNIGHGAKVIIESDRLIRVDTDENDLPRIGVFRIRKR